MADLLRTNIGDPSAPLSTRTPATPTRKTSAAFGQLAALGAAGTQLYIKEHEKKMTRQAMNDLVNDTINPDLQMHEGAYAQTVAKGTALKNYNGLSERVQAGEFNETSPEDFQKFMLSQHNAYKDSIAKSKFTELEAESYDNFWLQNESTLNAGQAGLYRKQVQFNQGRALLTEMSTLAKIPGVTADQLIDAGADPNYSMVGQDEIINASLMAAGASGSSELLDSLNDKLHFDVDPERSKIYRALYNATVKNEDADKAFTVFKNAKEVREIVAKQGYLTDEQTNTILAMRDNKGNELFSPKELARMLGESFTARSKTQLKTTATNMFSKNQQMSAVPGMNPALQKEVATEYMAQLEADGKTPAERDMIMGQKSVESMSEVKIPYYEVLANEIGTVDLDGIDEKEPMVLMGKLNRMRNFFAGAGNIPHHEDWYLGKNATRYRRLERTLKEVEGEDRERMSSAIRLVKQEELQDRLGRPPVKMTSDIEDSASSDAEDWRESQVGWVGDLRGEFGFDHDQFDAMWAEQLRSNMQRYGMGEKDAREKTNSDFNNMYSYTLGALQPFGAKDVTAIFRGKDPQSTMNTVMNNPDFNILLRDSLGITSDNIFEKEDFNMQLSVDGASLIISPKGQPEATFSLPMSRVHTFAEYNETDDTGLNNIDALFPKHVDDGMNADLDPIIKREQALAIRDADLFWYQNKQGTDKTYTEVHTTAAGNVIAPESLPSIEDVAAMTPEMRVKLHKAYKRVNYEGAKGWLTKASDIIRSLPLRLGFKSRTGVETFGQEKPFLFKTFVPGSIPEGIIPDTIQNIKAGIEFAKTNPIIDVQRGESLKEAEHIIESGGLTRMETKELFPPTEPVVEDKPEVTLDNVDKVTINSGRGKSNKNPGNLRASSLASGKKDGFATFRTARIGFNALVRQVGLDQSAKRDLTIRSFVYKYNPKPENTNQPVYIKFLTDGLGVPDTTKLADLNKVEIAKWVAKFESNTDITFK